MSSRRVFTPRPFGDDEFALFWALVVGGIASASGAMRLLAALVLLIMAVGLKRLVEE